ncbi:MAG: hypothetical protein JEZ00_22235 [Anaerolineaceae bacterium]|nr:hypothetical protein [Anaerolineaceae bacterium]
MKSKLTPIIIVIVIILAVILISSTLFQNTIQRYYQQAEQASIFENMHITRGFTLEWASETITYEILVRESIEPHIAIWSKVLTGNLQYSIFDQDGVLVYERQGRNVDVLEDIPLDAGHYTVQLTFSQYSGSARIGFSNIKFLTELPSAQYRTVSADSEAGFDWDYLLYLPESITSRYVLVIPNNTGFEESDFAFHQAGAQDLITEMSSLADELGTALLVPIFPRPGGEMSQYYTQNLDRSALLMDIDGYQRLDLQLLAMVDDARGKLSAQQIETDERFLLWGFSASGTFSDRFSLLHPERVQAVAAGGCTHSLPFAAYGGENLLYPIGTYDYKHIIGEPFDMREFASMPRFLYKGDQDNGGTDTIDGITYPSNEYFEQYKRAEFDASMDDYPIPITSGFTMTFDEEEHIKYRIYEGGVYVDEFIAVRDIYAEAGLLNSQFKLYPGVGHEITDEMKADVLAFFLEQIR